MTSTDSLDIGSISSISNHENENHRTTDHTTNLPTDTITSHTNTNNNTTPTPSPLPTPDNITISLPIPILYPHQYHSLTSEQLSTVQLKSHTLLTTPHFNLLPFTVYHIPLYYQWLQSSYILQMTCSEGEQKITLQDLYTLQYEQSYNPKKYTFIIQIKDSINKTINSDVNDNTLNRINPPNETPNEESTTPAYSPLLLHNCIGDINLLQHDYLDPHEAEIDIMIATETARNKGYATEILQYMLEWGHTHMNIQKYIAKIYKENTPSIHLFHKKLDFQLEEYVDVFDEYVYVKYMT